MVNGEVKSFEDLTAWQVAIDVAVVTYRLTEKYPKTEIYSLVSQMRRASSSISANIAEGCGRYGNKEKLQFYKIANGSLLELKSFYYLSERLGFISKDELDSALNKLTSSQKLVSALIRSHRDKS